MHENAAMIKNGAVINIIVVGASSNLPVLRKSLIEQGECDHLILVDETVQIGFMYDESKDIFLDTNGIRVYPEKTDSERITDLEQEITDVQLALCDIYESR